MYTNITLSGTVATGKSAAFSALSHKLSPLGWHCYQTGQLFRDYTRENVDPKGDLVDDAFNKELEERAARLLTTPHTLVEGWLAGFVAREMPQVLRVLLTCSLPQRIERVMSRDHVTKDAAADLIRSREETNIALWHKLYGNYDFFDKKYYSIVIDTGVLTEDEVTENILSHIVI